MVFTQLSSYFRSQVWLGKGGDKKKIVEFSTMHLPPISGARKRVLYDMGPLTIVRWPLQRALKLEPPLGQGSLLKRVTPPKEQNKTVFLQEVNYFKHYDFASLMYNRYQVQKTIIRLHV